ncbi:MAG: SGNH/GDSL hydrolase family protein [Gemmatimonadota bacterium]
MKAGPVHRRTESCLAAAWLVLVLLLILTDRSAAPWIGPYSRRAWGAVFLAVVAGAGWLASYRFSVPAVVDRARTVTLLGASTLLAALVIAEGLLRVLDPMPYARTDNGGRHAYDPDVGHVYRPNYSQILQTREWRQAWHSNGEGLRADHDYGPRRRGVHRILIVGDPFTVGDQVPLDSTYPGVIQRLMDERFGPGAVEVLNAGFPAYGTVNEARFIRKFGPGLQPDLVVVGMTPNDLVENFDPLRVVARDGYLVRSRATPGQMVQWRARRRWYSLRGQIDRSLLKRKLSASTLLRRLERRPAIPHRQAFLRQPDAEALRRYHLMERYLLEARDAARAIGARFALIAIPFRVQLGELPPDLDPNGFGKYWARVAGREGIPYLDLYPAFRDFGDPGTLYWVEDGHCTSAGYGLIGREAFRLLSGLLARDTSAVVARGRRGPGRPDRSDPEAERGDS